MVFVYRGEGPLTWRPLVDGEKLSASMRCNEGHYGILTDHTIHSDGRVTPSVVCPYCDFHDTVFLVEWVPS